MIKFIHALPAILFIVCMLPFLALIPAAFFGPPDLVLTEAYALLVFDGFTAAAAFAALAFVVLLIDCITGEY